MAPSPIRLLVAPPGNGDFLTDLVEELWIAQGYEITAKNLHLPGREIDLMAVHLHEEKRRIAECKAEVVPTGGTAVRAFAGLPELDDDATTGYFIALAGFTGTSFEQEKERRRKISFLDGAALMDDLIRARIVVPPGRAIETAVWCAAAVGAELAAEERLELLAHREIGWVWAVRFQAAGRVTHVALVDGRRGEALPRAQAEAVLAADREVGGELAALALLPAPDRREVDDPAELDRAEAVWLASLARDYEYLKLKGIAVENLPLRLPLAEMFVPLHARLRSPGDGRGPGGEARLRWADPPGAEEEEGVETASGRTAILDLLAGQPGLVLLGDPGSGKTTLLKYLALQLARGEGEALGLGGRLPLVVGLAAYAARAAEVPLSRFFEEHHRRELDCALPFERMASRALAEGRALVLLDGLDEVQDEAERHGIARRVESLFGFHRAAGNRFLITSRIEGYVPLEAPGLAVGTLEAFTDEDVEDFVRRWTAQVEAAAAGEHEEARRDAERERRELLAAVTTHPKIRELAQNPLMLTILALMKRQRVVLPERRIDLYQKYVETLLHNWHLARPLSGAGRKPRYDDKLALRILAPLALWMQERPGRGRVEREPLLAKLTELFRQTHPAEAEEEAARFLQEFPREASLLLEVGYRQYAFLHLSFLREGWIGGEEAVLLPSEAEWEKAARGAEGWIFPWGNEPEPNNANYGDTGIEDLSPVGCFPGGRCGSSGCEEMIGNVWEWTRSDDSGYPYDRSDGREDVGNDSRLRVVRGGSAWSDIHYARCAVRNWNDPSRRFRYIGFRPAVLPFSSDL